LRTLAHHGVLFLAEFTAILQALVNRDARVPRLNGR
jgi:hypothetical protein